MLKLLVFIIQHLDWGGGQVTSRGVHGGFFAPVRNTIMILPERPLEAKQKIFVKINSDKISHHTTPYHHTPPCTPPSLFLQSEGLKISTM